MAINIGNEATRAIVNLRGNPHFEDLVTALGVIAQSRYINAMQSDPQLRVHQTSHAGGIYELWESLHAAYMGVIPSQAKRVPVPKTRLESDANVG